MQRRNWEEFKGVAARRASDEIRSSIYPGGEITFDTDTFRKMGQPQAMFLLYDPSAKTIGLKPAHPAKPNAVIVRVRHEKFSCVVRSRPFFSENRITVDRTLRIPYPQIEDGVLILDLRTAVIAGRGRWKKLMKRK